MHKPKLKFGEVRDLTTARFAASAMADWIGFCFDPENENFINPLDAKTIIDWVAGPAFVGEFGIQDAEHINQIADLLNLDFVQLDKTQAEKIAAQINRPLIVRSESDFNEAEWILSSRVTGTKCILDCSSLDAGKLEIIRNEKPAAIELRGSKETATGIADLEPLNEFLEQLEMV